MDGAHEDEVMEDCGPDADNNQHQGMEDKDQENGEGIPGILCEGVAFFVP